MKTLYGFVSSAEENATVNTYAYANCPATDIGVWIGLQTDYDGATSTRKYTWTGSGAEASYTNFASGEPNGKFDAAVVMYTNGTWNDVGSENTRGCAVCEFDPATTGECLSQPTTACDDGKPCTFDSCLEDGTCQNAYSCDDGDECTTDVCLDDGCDHSGVCDDGDNCTLDSCSPATGCVNETVDCDDGDACTGDFCDPDALTLSCDGGTIARGRCYQAFQVSTLWSKARDACIALGGSLATIQSDAENEVVREIVQASCNGYDGIIGYNDVSEDGTYTWLSGEAVSYTNWQGGTQLNESTTGAITMNAVAVDGSTGFWGLAFSSGFKEPCYVCERTPTIVEGCGHANICN